ncbi:nucleoside kinase [Sinanaerobacter chloroacetimidivorans]|uniref:Nucleoside kinase n=1 Tax=Sinanaerobacter chloroacetimidivorans TaxID=2818044 RepID=A0A8J7W1P6_9FIRM|nr:nucleoside kinase [Sinanaerobacter chloroacetimidivorans]MBR0597570.1 nucleoside kinase [Sinanaerobacter chloroacetimidivorans]
MDINIKVKTEPRGQLQERIVEQGSTIEDLVKEYQNLPYTILAAKLDNKISELTKKIENPCTIEFLDMRDQAANLIYQRSVSLIYLKAIHDVLGKVSVGIENSLNKGLYTDIKSQKAITNKEVREIEARMHELVRRDIPFVKEILSKEDAFEVLIHDDHKEKARMLERAIDVNQLPFYSLEGFRNFFYGQMVPSTGYIQYFELMRYRRGVLLRFPHPSAPDKIPPYVDETKMYQAFGEATIWGRLMGISFVADLNEKVESGGYKEIIQISEALHEKKIAQIADMITKQKKRIILISGPSSSGKTTFARRLCIQLRVNGLEPLYLGTDDYFVERSQTPLDENGEPNFEDITSLDIKLFNDNMNCLLMGEEVDIPTFDFLKGEKVFGRRITRAKKGQPIVIEGIHGLNKDLTAEIKEEEKFKIYISPLTQLNIDDHNRIPTTDARMLRRMVRDYQFRGHSAQSTIRAWPKVRKGEDKNIFPFNGEADVFFNSVHIYELAVLKKYAEPLLKNITREEPEYSEAVRMLKFLQFFKTIEDDSIIANNSILREFIGGSIFV